MKARIFALTTQKDECAAIERLLRDHLYRGIEVEYRRFDPVRLNECGDIGRDYIDQMQASMFSADTFCLLVTQGGNWNYIGYRAGCRFFPRLPEYRMASVFPAVSMMGRMVMMPEAIQKELDCPRGFFYLFKPLDLQGVLLVNFQNERAIHEAIVKIGTRLKMEIVRLGRQQMALKRIKVPDIQELTELLGLEPKFIENERLRDEMLRQSPNLVARNISGPVRLEK